MDNLEKLKEIEKELVNFFQDLTEPIQNRAKEIQKISQNIPSLVTQELNEALIRSIEIEGVEQVINQMEDGKAPGLDGFTANFFHHFWDLVKEC